MSRKTLWISCDIKPLILPQSFIWKDYATNRVLTWSEEGGYKFSFWVLGDGWLDSDDSLGPLPHQPLCWMPIDSITGDWMDVKDPKEKFPDKNGQYLAWYEGLAEDTIMVLLQFKNGKWYYDTNGIEVTKPDRPLLWMHPPAVQKISKTPAIGIYDS